MVTWAVPGAECVCVHRFVYASAEVQALVPNLPVFRRRYVIRSVGECPLSGNICFKFEGLINPVVFIEGLSGETAFSAEHFQPIVRRTIEEDVTMFEGMLLTSGERV